MKYSKETFIDVMRDAMESGLISEKEFTKTTDSYLKESKLNLDGDDLYEMLWSDNLYSDLKNASRKINYGLLDLIKISDQLLANISNVKLYKKHSEIKDQIKDIESCASELSRLKQSIFMLLSDYDYLG